MRVLICGSRTWTDVEAIRDCLVNLPVNTTVIHGGALGADSLAGAVAQILGLKIEVYPADWEKYGKNAGFKRNLEMLDTKPDLVLAFWDGKSKGTAHTVGHAQAR